ncbi:hypothetical protein, partial [Fervidobacterium sp.]
DICLRKEVSMIMARYCFGLAAASALLLAISAPSYAQRTIVGGKPRVTITPAPWIPAPVPVQSIFPTPVSFSPFSGSDFFPAAPTTLWDNTTLTGYYFPVPNIVLDDVPIPDSRDTDSDNTYYLTQIEYGFYVPADLTVNGEIYLAGAGPDTIDPIQSDLAQPIATFSGEFQRGVYILTVAFERCAPGEQPALSVTADGNPYDLFWTGIRFEGCPSGDFPGMITAAGPDFNGDFFWWQGNQSCNGQAGPGFYWFGGEGPNTPRASFYIRVTGAATLADAIVSNPDIDGSGCVDDADLLQVLFAFGNTGSGLDEDVNCDGTVDDADLLEVLFNFGSGC